MSTASITEAELFPADVIVRAFGGEPVRLKATGRIGPSTIEVVGADESKAIGFPAADVYRFAPSVFKALRSAYDKGDPAKLEKAWNSAERFF